MHLTDRLADWERLPHEKLKAEIRSLIVDQPAEAVSLFAWLVGQHQIDVIRVEAEQQAATEAIAEAGRLRWLWQVAANCLDHNRGRLAKPRGDDEARMLGHVSEGAAWGPAGGTTSGWLDWLPQPDRRLEPTQLSLVTDTTEEVLSSPHCG